MPKLTVNVTQEHIDTGRPGSCTICPIALALEELTGQWPAVTADNISYCAYMPSVRTPSKARRFIENFDGGRPVEPFSFQIETEVQYPRMSASQIAEALQTD